MKYKFTHPELNKTIVVDSPDGSMPSEQEIDEMFGQIGSVPSVKREEAQDENFTKKQKEPSVSSMLFAPEKTAMRSLPEASKGLARGGYNLLGIPVDMANLVLSAIGLGSDKPVMGSDWLKSQVQDMTGENLAPDKTQGLAPNIAGAIGEVLPSMAMPLAGSAMKGQQVSQSILPLIKSAIGAGTGVGVARTKKPDSPIAEIAGGLVGAGIPGAVSATRERLSKAAPHLVAKGLRPSKTMAETVEEAEDIGKTILSEKGININKSGQIKAEGFVKKYGSQLRAAIDRGDNANKTIPLKSLTRYVDDTVEYAAHSEDPKEKVESVKGLKTAFEEFWLSKYPDGNIPLKEVQKLKTTIYARNPSSYGETKKAMSTEFGKQIARGARQSIEDVIPEVGDINKKLGQWDEAWAAISEARRKRLAEPIRFNYFLNAPSMYGGVGRLYNKLGKQPPPVKPDFFWDEAFAETPASRNINPKQIPYNPDIALPFEFPPNVTPPPAEQSFVRGMQASPAQREIAGLLGYSRQVPMEPDYTLRFYPSPPPALWQHPRTADQMAPEELSQALLDMLMKNRFRR